MGVPQLSASCAQDRPGQPTPLHRPAGSTEHIHHFYLLSGSLHGTPSPPTRPQRTGHSSCQALFMTQQKWRPGRKQMQGPPPAPHPRTPFWLWGPAGRLLPQSPARSRLVSAPSWAQVGEEQFRPLFSQPRGRARRILYEAHKFPVALSSIRTTLTRKPAVRHKSSHGDTMPGRPEASEPADAPTEGPVRWPSQPARWPAPGCGPAAGIHLRPEDGSGTLVRATRGPDTPTEARTLPRRPGHSRGGPGRRPGRSLTPGQGWPGAPAGPHTLVAEELCTPTRGCLPRSLPPPPGISTSLETPA